MTGPDGTRLRGTVPGSATIGGTTTWCRTERTS
jgi:hypothetical protein